MNHSIQHPLEQAASTIERKPKRKRRGLVISRTALKEAADFIRSHRETFEGVTIDLYTDGHASVRLTKPEAPTFVDRSDQPADQDPNPWDAALQDD